MGGWSQFIHSLILEIKNEKKMGEFCCPYLPLSFSCTVLYVTLLLVEIHLVMTMEALQAVLSWSGDDTCSSMEICLLDQL